MSTTTDRNEIGSELTVRRLTPRIGAEISGAYLVRRPAALNGATSRGMAKAHGLGKPVRCLVAAGGTFSCFADAIAPVPNQCWQDTA